MRKIYLTLFIFCIFGFSFAENNKAHDSVVKIFTTAYSYGWQQPWHPPSIESFTGSGCIIEGNRILTNAHNVSNQIFIEVKKAGDPKRYTAKLISVEHDCDLAILTVEDRSFFQGTVPMAIGDMPKRQETVTVYGFPIGGDEISLTQGIVSRIETHRYAHRKAKLLTVQIDAAINPGNSGGPVVKDGKMVGIAFQGIAAAMADGIGYMIPPPVIRHFLEDRSRGFPSLLLKWQNMKNKFLKKVKKMPPDETGVLLTKISYKSPAKGILNEGDILTDIDDVSIANDGTIPFDKNTRTDWENMISNNFIGKIAKLKLIRDGKSMTVEVPLKARMFVDRLVQPSKYDIKPTYYILAGLIFQPLSGNLANSIAYWGGVPMDATLISLFHNAFSGKISKDKKQLVMLSKVLPYPINKGYESFGNLLIKEVNGVKIGSMQDLVKAFENNKEKYHKIISEDDIIIILDREEAATAHKEIVEKYRILADRSEDLI